jgi:hypothetical protein
MLNVFYTYHIPVSLMPRGKRSFLDHRIHFCDRPVVIAVVFAVAGTSACNDIEFYWRPWHHIITVKRKKFFLMNVYISKGNTTSLTTCKASLICWLLLLFCWAIFYPKQNFIHISKGETADFRLQEFKILRETPTRQTSDFHKTSKDLIRLQNIYET